MAVERAGGCASWADGRMVTWAPIASAPLLALAPAVSAAETPWPGWPVLAAALAAYAAAVLGGSEPLPFRLPRLVRLARPEYAAGVLALITLAATAAFPGEGWVMLYTMLSLAVGTVLGPRAAPWAVAAVALAATVLMLARGSQPAEALFGAGLTPLLAGLTVYGFRRLGAIVAELDRTREELARAAVAQERLRFSRDLHDLLGHTLSVIVVKAEAARRLAPRDPGATAAHAADIESIGREALREVREAVTGYRDAGLALELERARSVLAAAGVECVVSESGPALSPEADALLGWVVREGVTNVVRHARASRCHIALHRETDPIRVEISDDGRGATPGAPLAGAGTSRDVGAGSGLRGLRERLAASGGRLDAAPLGGGFRLIAEIPHPAPEYSA
ncbi:two-component system sensor histidine kinase DesK [Thermocatellispora tengchongensis]|uniref:Two-component system sensor histidine kinase DesK n=1 Tax=Thermocatellispora tengchongensis TaxID=1073253 RepID=A0A840NXE4_9ACTN|nr:sensor histidine kinase [Thermocatellispora tengchongensis]MBB5130341.1 two-component system sensor histidine kinase DesK [Thermocatellispora tengchongensis]